MKIVAAEKFVDNLLTEQARDQPSDTVKPEEILIELPKWFDEDLFNKGRKFFWDHCFALSGSMLLGLVSVFAVPSILKILVGSRRSSSAYTAYKRYLSTLLHVTSWFENELKPGSISWKSLTAVRIRHLQATMASKLKDNGIVSQRDLALTQFGFFGFSMLKPDEFGIYQLQEGQWEAYNHFWRVLGHVLGLEDRYNVCRESFEETRVVCRLLMERVFTPCLSDVPEYFEHMTRVMLEGMSTINPLIDINAFIYRVKYLSDVPGYIYTEADRFHTQEKIKEYLRQHNKSLDEGVYSSDLIHTSQVEGLPGNKVMLYCKDFESFETVPAYKALDGWSRYRLGLLKTIATLYTFHVGRLYFNFNYLYSLYLMKYLPYLAMWKFGLKKAYVNIFKEDPMDETVPKTNEEYYNEKPTSRPWYKFFSDFIL